MGLYLKLPLRSVGTHCQSNCTTRSGSLEAQAFMLQDPTGS
ncbi:MAG: hypothetical protein QOK39_1554, partial [Acidimicrobiaceae bacterium]|nr:hypothetical protein [Acidimicrobiaceae bacterium]